MQRSADTFRKSGKGHPCQVNASGQQRSKPVEPSPSSYFSTFLEDSLTTTNALAGQVWGLNEIGQLTKIASSDPDIFQVFEQPQFVHYHRDLLSRVLATGQPSETCLNDDEQSKGLSSRVIFLSPLFLDDRTVGIVELILSRPATADQLAQFASLLSQAQQYLIDQDDRHASSTPERPENANRPSRAMDPGRQTASVELEYQVPGNAIEPVNRPTITAESVEELVYLLHNQSDLPHVASTSVNEVRRLLECDRVSLATRLGGNCEITAVSGQDSLQRKSDAVRAMQNLAEQVIRSGVEIGFAPGEVSQDHVFDNARLEFLEASGASSFIAVPLLEPENIDFESSVHVAEMKPFAAMILENFSNKPVPQSQSIMRLAVHISQALFHAANAEQVFLLPLRRRIGRWATLAKMTRAKLFAGLVAMLLVVGSLVLVKAPYHVTAKGRLMPVQQFRAYAPFDGQVRQVLVQNQQRVVAGQILVNVHGEQLVTQALGLKNEMAEKRKLLEAYKAQQDSQAETISPAEQTSLSARIMQYELEIDGLLEQLELTNGVLAQSDIQSPINGTVATFQPDELLKQRPVNRGDLLLEVMDEAGPWRLELQVPSKRMGHLMPRFAGNRHVLPVAFIQATSPEHTFEGEVAMIANRTSSSDDGNTTIAVFADIKPDQDLRCTIGAEVTARIRCGKRSLGYVWFGDIIDWFRSRMW